MLIEIILLALAVPAGLLLAWLAEDELKDGRRWFTLLIIISLALALFFFVYDYNYIALTSIFISIATFVSFVKSKRAKRKGF